MRICLCSSQFYPVIGGVPQVTDSLADFWILQGHEVKVVTDTPERETGYYCGITPPGMLYSVYRSPSRQEWKRILNASDLIVSNGISVKHLGAWRSSRLPLVFIHQMYQYTFVESLKTPHRLARWMAVKLALKSASKNVYISRAVAKQVGVENGIVIHNPTDRKFKIIGDVKKNFDFGFFGRIQHEKGLDLLIQALSICRTRGKKLTLCVYGDGIERDHCFSLATTLGVSDCISWFPFAQGENLVNAMNSVEVVVVPSRWPEPMGIVATESMTCGRPVIGSSAGGLGEVLEGYGLTFANDSSGELAAKMFEIASNPKLKETIMRRCLERSKDFTIEAIGGKYLDLFRSVLSKNKDSSQQ